MDRLFIFHFTGVWMYGNFWKFSQWQKERVGIVAVTSKFYIHGDQFREENYEQYQLW